MCYFLEVIPNNKVVVHQLFVVVVGVTFSESFKIIEEFNMCVWTGQMGQVRGHITPTPMAKNKIVDIMGCGCCCWHASFGSCQTGT